MVYVSGFDFARSHKTPVSFKIVFLQEAKASYKCMDDTNYNRDACLEYFKAYKECKKQMV